MSFYLKAKFEKYQILIFLTFVPTDDRNSSKIGRFHLEKHNKFHKATISIVNLQNNFFYQK